MNVFIAGLGLIGGSFAKAFKRHTKHTVYGYDIDTTTAEFALAHGAIDKIATEEDLPSADLTVICLYPEACVDFIKRNLGKFKETGVVMDACGIKRALYEGIGDIVNRSGGPRFVGAHPMAGREHSGFDYSGEELYEGASLIVTPENADADAVKFVCDTAKEIGFGSCKITDVKTHDLMIAYTSQLAHVLACSYISDPLAENHRGFSAGSFRDVTRVAYINDEMWSELFLENAEPLSKEIGVLINNLQRFKDSIDRGDKEQLRAMMRKAKAVKEQV